MSETGRTILIIAGNPEDRAMLRRCLSQAGEQPYEFLEAAAGVEGVV
jgi:CheY-like chemotaxis protein